MKKPRVIVIGGGFAGQAFLTEAVKQNLDITLFDHKDYADFLPLLPDIISGTVSPKSLQLDLKFFCTTKNITFIQQSVFKIAQSENFILAKDYSRHDYDYLVIAAGAETNYRENQELRRNSYKLSNSADALLIKNKVLNNNIENILISGGGYTGIEIATHIHKLVSKNKINRKITLIEFSPRILSNLPEWLHKYISSKLQDLGITCEINDEIVQLDKQRAILKSGKIFENYLLIWSAGIITPECVRNVNCEKDQLGRIKVSATLQATNNIFVLGDCAHFSKESTVLRPAVRFAIQEGKCAAKNIRLLIRGEKPLTLQPTDLGYIVPLANACGAGEILGLKFSGFLPVILHYAVALCFSANWRLRWRLFLDLISATLGYDQSYEHNQKK